MLLAILSDTHSLLRPEVLPALQGADHILHLGDVGDIAILHELQKLAPVTAIRGNIDRHGPCSQLPETEVVEFLGQHLYLLHDLKALTLAPAAARFAAVLSGHTHQPLIETRKGVLYLNPGSCGPRRFNLPTTFALLTITESGELYPSILDLNPKELTKS
jgi:putative phosphoesterase